MAAAACLRPWRSLAKAFHTSSSNLLPAGRVNGIKTPEIRELHRNAVGVAKGWGSRHAPELGEPPKRLRQRHHIRVLVGIGCVSYAHIKVKREDMLFTRPIGIGLARCLV